MGLTLKTQPDLILQLNAAVYDELMGLSGQFRQLKTWSPVLPPDDNDMDQATQDSEDE